jgi:hypothetical protein
VRLAAAQVQGAVAQADELRGAQARVERGVRERVPEPVFGEELRERRALG